MLSGSYSVRSNCGEWTGLEWADVFTAGPTALYLPRHTDFTVQEGYKLTVVLLNNLGYKSIGALSRSLGQRLALAVGYSPMPPH